MPQDYMKRDCCWDICQLLSVPFPSTYTVLASATIWSWAKATDLVLPKFWRAQIVSKNNCWFKPLNFRVTYYATIVSRTSSNLCPKATSPLRPSLTLDVMASSPETLLSHIATSYSSSQHFPSFIAQFYWCQSPFSSVCLGKATSFHPFIMQNLVCSTSYLHPGGLHPAQLSQ